MSYNPYQQTPSAAIMPGKSNEEYAREKVRTPAILLMITGVINALVGVVAGSMMPALFFGMREEIEMEMAKDPELSPELIEVVINLYGWGGIVFAVISLIVGSLAIMGAIRMLSLRSWELGLFAAILSVIPCFQSCWLMSLPVGIYAIVVLCDARVKSGYGR